MVENTKPMFNWKKKSTFLLLFMCGPIKLYIKKPQPKQAAYRLKRFHYIWGPYQKFSLLPHVICYFPQSLVFLPPKVTNHLSGSSLENIYHDPLLFVKYPFCLSISVDWVIFMGWLVKFLNVLVNNKAISRTGPKTERLTMLRAATHETELGDHDFCLSRSHYNNTDPTSRERAVTAGIEPGTSSPGVARSTNWATGPSDFYGLTFQALLFVCMLYLFYFEKAPEIVRACGTNSCVSVCLS